MTINQTKKRKLQRLMQVAELTSQKDEMNLQSIRQKIVALESELKKLEETFQPFMIGGQVELGEVTAHTLYQIRIQEKTRDLNIVLATFRADEVGFSDKYRKSEMRKSAVEGLMEN